MTLREISGDLFARNATVTLSHTLNSVGNQVFTHFTGTVNSKSLADYLAELCPRLVSAGDNAFENCQALPETVELPKIQVIGARAFSGTPIRNATFGPELRTLGQFIFDTP